MIVTLRGCNGFDGSLERRNSHPQSGELRQQAGNFLKRNDNNKLAYAA